MPKVHCCLKYISTDSHLSYVNKGRNFKPKAGRED